MVNGIVVIRKAESSEHQTVEAFYREVKYQGSLNPRATVFVAMNDQQLIGVVQLCPENGYVALRGMQIAPAFQGRSIGSQLLEQVSIELADKPCYCIPWSHLEAFYQRIGFEKIPAQDAPGDLRDRYVGYLDRGLDVILMQRIRRNDPSAGLTRRS